MIDMKTFLLKKLHKSTISLVIKALISEREVPTHNNSTINVFFLKMITNSHNRQYYCSTGNNIMGNIYLNSNSYFGIDNSEAQDIVSAASMFKALQYKNILVVLTYIISLINDCTFAQLVGRVAKTTGIWWMDDMEPGLG